MKSNYEITKKQKSKINFVRVINNAFRKKENPNIFFIFSVDALIKRSPASPQICIFLSTRQ